MIGNGAVLDLGRPVRDHHHALEPPRLGAIRFLRAAPYAS